MRLHIQLPTLMAGLIAGCATAATLLPAPAFAAGHPGTAAPARAATAAPKPLGASVPDTGAADPRPAATTADRPTAVRTARTATPSCTPADFGSRSGAELVAFVRGASPACVNALFDITGTDAAHVFAQQQMLTVADAFRQQATAYTGDNSTGILQLVLFLRAGYYVQSNDAGDVGPYDSALGDATKAALDAFFASTHARDVNDGNGAVLKEVLVLTDSANLQADYLGVYQRLLNGYDSGYNAFPKMVGAVNSLLSAPLWRANWNADYVKAVGADPGVVNALGAFALKHRDLLGGPDAVLDTNAGNDLARTAGDGGAVEAAAKPLVKQVLDGSAITGTTGPLYVHTAYQANAYDLGQCSYYGTCDLTAKLTAAVLPHKLVCDNRTILAEALSPADLAAVCASLRGEDTFFHKLVKDGGAVNPYDKTITLPVFATKDDYATYSWAIFGNTTDNGGQTVMDPTDPANQAVSVMYQKPYNDGFTANVWNLNHEYTHYLDGIYDMKGSFGTEVSVPDIWWVEGVAEYESYAYRGTTDTEAMSEAAKHTYKLSTLFQNTYENSDTTRTYPWGYLAVRYMVEHHPDVVQNMLGHFRTGDYTGGYAVYNSLGTAYDADFDAWLNTCAAGACYAAGPTALFDSQVSGATVRLTDRSVQTGGGRITRWHWTFGDGTFSDQRNPSHSYAKPGTYTVDLTVTDAAGRTASTPASVTVTAAPPAPPACTDPDPRALGRDCSRTELSGAAGSTDYRYVYVPAGTKTLTITTSGGTGTSYLYYDADTWASPDAFTARSTNPGTDQSITVLNPAAGYHHLSLQGATDYHGVTVSTSF